MPQKIDLKQPLSRELNLTNERSAINEEARTVEIAFSSEAAYERWYGKEILDHSADAVDLTRLNSGGALLLGHDTRTQIGVVERAWIDADRKGRALVRFSKSALGEEIFQDVKDGIRRLVSVGYSVEEYRLEGESNNIETYRMTKWTPFEVSIVPVPADASVGVGRGFNHVQQKENAMPEKNPAANATAEAPATTETRASETPHIEMGSTNPLQAERERMKEIRALARQFDKTELGDAAIDNGVSVDAFRAQLLGTIGKNSAIRTSESPEIGMTERDVKQYSFLRALAAAADPVNAHVIAPFELECSRAAQNKRGDSRTERESALTIPVDVLSRGMSLSADAAGSAMRMLGGRRDLTVGSATGGGNTVATDLLSGSFIELLRNGMVLNAMGATFLTDLNGNIAIPSQTGTATAYWVAESGSPTESQQTVGQVTMTPKTVGAYTDYSRRLLLQSSLDVEAFVRADLAAIIGLAIQDAALNGTGSDQPTGILNASGIGAVVGGANGAAPTYENMVDLAAQIEIANASMGNLAYLTNSKVASKLRKTPLLGNTVGVPTWTGSGDSAVVAGYNARITNAMPSNLTKGTSVGVCSSIIFGNWADLLIGMWGGLDIMLDPYSGATSGTKRVVALQDVDVTLRRVASFAAMKDALTA